MGTVHRSPVWRSSSRYAVSPSRSHKSPPRSSPGRSPSNYKSSGRTRSPVGTGSARSLRSPAKDKLHTLRQSPPKRQSFSPTFCSHSPRLKRPRHGQDERDAFANTERNGSRDDGRGRHRERRHIAEDSDREKCRDREVGEDRRQNRDGDGFSRARHEHSFSPKRRSHDNERSNEVTNTRRAENYRNPTGDSISKMRAAEEALEAKQKQKPSFELSGKLAEETNRVKGVTLRFNEPPDACKSNIRWRLYVFKAGEILNDPLYIHRQSCYLFGRERRVADIPTDHPSCSKQHAVIQFRQVTQEQVDGTISKQVRPYLMDLGSTNGTFINDNHIEPQRYYELFEKDTIRFGNSSREYVILHENSAEE